MVTSSPAPDAKQVPVAVKDSPTRAWVRLAEPLDSAGLAQRGSVVAVVAWVVDVVDVGAVVLVLELDVGAVVLVLELDVGAVVLVLDVLLLDVGAVVLVLDVLLLDVGAVVLVLEVLLVVGRVVDVELVEEFGVVVDVELVDEPGEVVEVVDDVVFCGCDCGVDGTDCGIEHGTDGWVVVVVRRGRGASVKGGEDVVEEGGTAVVVGPTVVGEPKSVVVDVLDVEPVEGGDVVDGVDDDVVVDTVLGGDCGADGAEFGAEGTDCGIENKQHGADGVDGEDTSSGSLRGPPDGGDGLPHVVVGDEVLVTIVVTGPPAVVEVEGIDVELVDVEVVDGVDSVVACAAKRAAAVVGVDFGADGADGGDGEDGIDCGTESEQHGTEGADGAEGDDCGAEGADGAEAGDDGIEPGTEHGPSVAKLNGSIGKITAATRNVALTTA